MGLFDKAFKLPIIGGALQSSVQKATNQAVSYAVGSASTKLTEAASGVMGVMGGLGPFAKMGANLPTIADLTADKLLSGIDLDTGMGTLIDSLEGLNIESGEAQASASAINAATGGRKQRSMHKVSLREKSPGGDVMQVVYFEVLPEIVEAHTTEYEAVAPAQFPGAFQKFKGSATTQWTINATFISRTSHEATKNYHNLMALRGWMKPFYGNKSGQAFPEKLGAPPPVLLLTGLRDLIGPVPVVITSMNWTWPRDVDYIATLIESEADGNYIPFPVVLQVPIQVVEAYSIEEFNEFSLADYRAGRLGAAFSQDNSRAVVDNG